MLALLLTVIFGCSDIGPRCFEVASRLEITTTELRTAPTPGVPMLATITHDRSSTERLGRTVDVALRTLDHDPTVTDDVRTLRVPPGRFEVASTAGVAPRFDHGGQQLLVYVEDDRILRAAVVADLAEAKALHRRVMACSG